jgi:diguanylate cyclase (GGDEF)-like protein/PAS domain S-box-containing protein
LSVRWPFTGGPGGYVKFGDEMKLPTQSSTFWRRVIDRVPAGVFILDHDGEIVHWNDWLAHHTHIAPEEAIGRRLADLFPGIDQTRFAPALAKVFAGGSPRLLSRALNRFLIPVRLGARANASLMSQKVQLAPIKSPESEILVMVTIFDVTDFASRIHALVKRTQSLEEMSNHDPLTGLYNRHFMSDWLDQQIKIAKRRRESLTCLMLDLDRFKSINDTYGHPVGDLVLQACATIIQGRVRESDVVVRFGGEEFVVLMPSCALSDGIWRADEIIGAIRDAALGPLQPGRVTCSGGVSAYSPGLACTAPELIERADKLLYAAKSAGGDRVFAP